MHQFRKSYDSADRGMTIRRNGVNQETAIIDSLRKGITPDGFPAPAVAELPTGTESNPVMSKSVQKRLAAQTTPVEFVDEPTLAYETITPEVAAEYLGTMLKNRNIKARPLSKLVYAMKTGQWKNTGESIKFNTDGNLIDGQHRLTAIIEAGVTLRILVARNIPVDAHGSIDGGCARSHGDQFAIIGGVTNGNRVAASVKMFYMLTTGKYPDLLTFEDCLELRNENIEAFEWAARAFSNNTMFDNGVIAGAAAIAYQHDPERVDAFFEQLHSGLNLRKGSPILALREAIINIKTAGKSRNNFGSITDRYRFALKVLRAISLYLDGKDIVGPSNLYATPLGLKYFIRNASIPNFMTQD